MNLSSIVAVHGLNGNAIKTWSKGDICWLSDPKLLPKYIPNARILAYGYNASVFGVKGRVTSSDGIMQHAQTLIAQLAADRELEGTSERPIIFLCHSLGGIIVKRVNPRSPKSDKGLVCPDDTLWLTGLSGTRIRCFSDGSVSSAPTPYIQFNL